MSFFIGFADELMKLAQPLPVRRVVKKSGSLEQVRAEEARSKTPANRKLQLQEIYQKKEPVLPNPYPITRKPVRGT